jgi:hypothetical protein
VKVEGLSKLIHDSYAIETTGLSAVANSELFPAALPLFADYEGYVRRVGAARREADFANVVSRNTGIICANGNRAQLQEIFFIAHLACCCELFEGWNMPISLLRGKMLGAYVKATIQRTLHRTPDACRAYSRRVHSADTIRAIQILRMLGLLSFDSRRVRQLSLGAGGGYKDIYSAHKIPSITRRESPDNNAGEDVLSFHTTVTMPQRVILIDNDKGLNDHYRNYNATSNGSIIALVDDASSALQRLSKPIQRGEMQPNDFVAGIRVDHRMIRDVPYFFRQIAAVIEPQADFVLTVGAGYSTEEFDGRLRLISRVYSFLRDLGLKPVQLILHNGQTLAEKRERPAFGYAATATHAMVCCRLQKARLA